MDEIIGEPATAAENAAQQKRGRPFEPGVSGNPAGRPKGSRNKSTMAMEALLEDEGPALISKVIEKALDGDVPALRLCIQHVLPARRDRPVVFELPKINTAADALEASSAVLAACAEGTLSLGEADQIMKLISIHVLTLEVTEIEARLATLEKERKS